MKKVVVFFFVLVFVVPAFAQRGERRGLEEASWLVRTLANEVAKVAENTCLRQVNPAQCRSEFLVLIFIVANIDLAVAAASAAATAGDRQAFLQASADAKRDPIRFDEEVEKVFNKYKIE